MPIKYDIITYNISIYKDNDLYFFFIFMYRSIKSCRLWSKMKLALSRSLQKMKLYLLMDDQGFQKDFSKQDKIKRNKNND